MCGQTRCRNKITRHLIGYHKVTEPLARSLACNSKPPTTKGHLKCHLCGANQTQLTRHLIKQHNLDRNVALEMMKESKEIKKTDEINEIEADLGPFKRSVQEYYSYETNNLGYKEKTTRFESRISNLERFGKIVVEVLNCDPNDILTISENDYENEVACENMLGEYIRHLKGSNLKPNSAVCYLTDIKELVRHTYRYKAKCPLINYLCKQIANCKDANRGKMDEDKYIERVDLVRQLSKHEESKLVLDIKEDLEKSRSDTDWIRCRDYLISRILIDNAQRNCCVYNMTLDEFESAIKTVREDLTMKRTIAVKKHKTSKYHGAAKIHVPQETYERIQKYIKYGRPTSDSNFVFLTHDGNALLSQTVWTIFKSHIKQCRIGIDHINVCMWRRAANSMIQATGDSALKEISSKQLTHSIHEGETSYLNNTSSKRSSLNHDRFNDAIYRTAEQCHKDDTEEQKRALLYEKLQIKKDKPKRRINTSTENVKKRKKIQTSDQFSGKESSLKSKSKKKRMKRVQRKRRN